MQQFRWHQTTKSLYSVLRNKTEGLCRNTRKSFGGAVYHFIIGGGKTCIIYNSTGDIFLIGKMYVKKHENNVDDRIGYVTFYRTRTASGLTGTTVLLLLGKIPGRFFNYEFLMDYGASVGSVIVIT